MHWWIRQYPVTVVADEAKISEVSAIQCYQYLTDIFVAGGSRQWTHHFYLADQELWSKLMKVSIGISQKLLKYNLLLQFHRGQPSRSEQWVFGMVDTSQTPPLGVMVLVQRRDAATLLPIIQQHVRPGSTVWSDEWAAYRNVAQLPQVTQHSTVNHSIQFRNPTTGVHTQNIESYWNRAKTKFKRMKGVQETMLSSHLDEFMWRERYGRTGSKISAGTLHSVILSKSLRFFLTMSCHSIIFIYVLLTVIQALDVGTKLFGHQGFHLGQATGLKCLGSSPQACTEFMFPALAADLTNRCILMFYVDHCV